MNLIIPISNLRRKSTIYLSTRLKQALFFSERILTRFAHVLFPYPFNCWPTQLYIQLTHYSIYRIRVLRSILFRNSMFSSKNISSVNMVWNGSRDICSRDALSRLIGRLLSSPAAVGGGGGGGEIVCEENEEEILWGNAEVALGQLCNLMFQLLEWPSSCHHDGSRRRRRMRRITPVGLASLLFGIASTLVFIGSTAFMIGIMMMPLIAMLATTLCFVAFLTNLAAPGMTFWPWCRPQQHDRHDYALHQPS